MDLNDFRSAVTVASLLMFVAVAIWTWQRGRRAAFEAAAQLPFTGDAQTDPAGVHDE